MEPQRESLRQLAKSNLYFLCKGVLKFSEPFYSQGLDPDTHGSLCAALDEVQLPYARALDLWPRGALKTHIITIGKNIQHYLRDPNVRVLLVSSNEDNAKKNLTKIKEIFETNTFLHWLFPECVPDTKGDKWTETAIVLPRTLNKAAPTFKAIGWGRRITGHHFDIINKDDLIDEKTEKSPEVMEKIIYWHKMSENLFDGPTVGVDHVVGTRYLMGDLYGWIIKNDPRYVTRRVQALYKEEGCKEWKSFWPARFPVDALLAMKEKDAYIFACQQMNDPRDQAITDFRAEWLQYYTLSPDAKNILVEVF